MAPSRRKQTERFAERADRNGARMRDSWPNQAAGRWLAARREQLDATQPQFAQRLAELLTIPVPISTLSGWETGSRLVPAAVLAACLALALDPSDAGAQLAQAVLNGPPENLHDKVARLEAELAKLLAERRNATA